MKIAQALLKHVARARISEYSRRARWRREVSSTSGHARSTSPNPRSAHRTEATNENRDHRVAGVSTHRRGTSWLAWSAPRGSALAWVRSWHRTGGYPRDTPFRRARKEAVKTKLTAGSSPRHLRIVGVPSSTSLSRRASRIRAKPAADRPPATRADSSTRRPNFDLKSGRGLQGSTRHPT
jgi:hypothetical protein